MSSVHGTVTDASTHKPVPGLGVTLRVARGGQARTVGYGHTDTHGGFALAAPAPSPGATYAVVATYRGISYSAAVARNGVGVVQPVHVAVYDTTRSDSGLLAPSVVVGLRRMGRNLAVIEEWTFVNASLYTDVGTGARPGRHTASFPLPPGATNALVVPGASSSAVSATVERGAVVVNTILRPTVKMDPNAYPRVTCTFTLPGHAAHPTLPIQTRYPIVALDVFALNARLVAPGFKKTPLSFGGRRVTGWELDRVAGHSTLAVGVDGPPAAVAAPPAAAAAPAGPAPFPSLAVAILIGAGFVLMLLLGLFRGVRPTVTAPHRGTVVAGRERVEQERARLVDAIAALDLQHARGRIAPSRYQRARARDKERLLSRHLGE